MIRRKKTAPEPAAGVVAGVQAQTAQAAALATIPGQHMLADPSTNPATRQYADQLRDALQRQVLDDRYGRRRRRLRVASRRADHAERALEALQAARETRSPARAVLALHQGRHRYVGAALGASLLLSVGSALGVEAFAQQHQAPTGVGYLAEVGMTGLATAVVMYRSHLAAYDAGYAAGPGRQGRVSGWQARVLWTLTLMPLLASVIASTAGSGPIGAACSIGAAAFALLAYVIADRSASAIHDAAGRAEDAEEEAELRRIAMGDDLVASIASVPAGDGDQDEVEPVDELADEVEAFLAGQDPGEPGTPAELPPAPDADGDQGAAAAPSGQGQDASAAGCHIDPEPKGHTGLGPAVGGGHIGAAQGCHIDADQARPPTRLAGGERVLPATQARIAAGASTRQRIAAHIAAHPGHTAEQIAAALGVSIRTVKRHRSAIRSAIRSQKGES